MRTPLLLALLILSPLAFGGSGTFTIKESGGDYITIAAWQAAQKANLTGTGPCIAIISGTFVNAETASIFINGWTTTPADYIEIRTATDVVGRHSGIWDNTLHRIVVDAGNAMNFRENYVRISGLQLSATATTGNSQSLIGSFIGTASGEMWFSYNLFRGDVVDTTYWQRGIDISTVAIDKMKIWNNIFYDFDGSSASDILINVGAENVYLYNNTFIGGSKGAKTAVSNSIHAKNNIFYNQSTIALDGTYDTTTDYNSTDLGALPGGGSNNRISQTIIFAASPTGDFHLHTSDGGAKDFGVDLSGDGNLAITDDIDGDTRPATWDIGADEFTSGASPTPTPTPVPQLFLGVSL